MKSSAQRAHVGSALVGVALCASLVFGGTLAYGATKSSASSKADSNTAAWSMETDCTACHVAQTSSLENEDCLVTVHSAMGCTDCHADEKGLTKAHKKATPEKAEKVKRLRKSVIDTELCLTCHGPANELAQKLGDTMVLVDREGTEVNPHAVPANDDHLEAVTCAECHAMHNPASEKDTEKTTLEKAQDFCTSCHHDNVFACHTCHD